MPAYDAVLFDNDGILVEPPARETQAAAARAAFRAAGVDEVDPDHVEAVVSGVTPDRLRAVARASGVDPAILWAARERLDEQSQIAAIEAGTRDVYDDVSAIADLSLPAGVVSNNHHTTVEFVLEHFDLRGAFDTYYGRERGVESLGHKKPDPHYLERALADLGADSALYVGDREKDVEAARRAEIDAAFVRRAHSADVTLSVSPAYEVDDLRGIVDILAEQ